jgi:hypothetical protein
LRDERVPGRRITSYAYRRLTERLHGWTFTDIDEKTEKFAGETALWSREPGN